jgi:NADH-quinone oxidoreductase subunit G
MIKNINDIIPIYINGIQFYVRKGKNLIDQVKKFIEIPHFCYHPNLKISGNCRMCLVEIGILIDKQLDKKTYKTKNSNHYKIKNGKLDNFKIKWNKKPTIACSIKTHENLCIRTNSSIIKNSRKGIMEFLLLNHPLDCPICDQAGECKLQEHSFEYGRGYSRFLGKKINKRKNFKITKDITLDRERCILCSRCVRFYKDFLKKDIIGFSKRGVNTELSILSKDILENDNYSLNIVDICPVGALTSNDFRMKMRVWFLKRTKSICFESSTGVNTYVWSKNRKIYRITPRRNDFVNKSWMTNSGRLIYKKYDDKIRIKNYLYKKDFFNDPIKISKKDAIKLISEKLISNKNAIVISGSITLEEFFLIQRIVKYTNSKIFFISKINKGDNILLSNDRSENLRGALITKLIKKYPIKNIEKNLRKIIFNIKNKKIESILIYNENIFNFFLENKNKLYSILKEHKVFIIYFGNIKNFTSKISNLVVPILTNFEKSGSFINRNFRLQKFQKAIKRPFNIQYEIIVMFHIIQNIKKKLSKIKNKQKIKCLLHKKNNFREIKNWIWTKLNKKFREFNNIKNWDSIPNKGIIINNNFKEIKFLD